MTPHPRIDSSGIQELDMIAKTGNINVPWEYLMPVLAAKMIKVQPGLSSHHFSDEICRC